MLTTSAGLIHLAICDADEVSRNRGGDSNHDSYPCDRVSPLSVSPRAYGGSSHGLCWGVVLGALLLAF